MFHRVDCLIAEAGYVKGAAEVKDSNLIERIISSYRASDDVDIGSVMWESFFNSYHKPTHNALMQGDVDQVTKIYRLPTESSLSHGFDNLRAEDKEKFKNIEHRNTYGKKCLSSLLRFAEYLGAVRLDNSEAWEGKDGYKWRAEELIGKLNDIGCSFTVPTPFPDEVGLSTPLGILSYRATQALFFTKLGELSSW
jgi:hypothetical protein